MARIPSMKTAGVGLAALVGVALSFGQSFAQEATSHWIKAGFARPAADGKAGGVDGIGGTIYYAVYQLQPGKEKTNDPYGTGFADLAQQFVAGGGLSQSPANLVPESLPKYLYLYQVVNDKGLDTVSKDGVRLRPPTPRLARPRHRQLDPCGCRSRPGARSRRGATSSRGRLRAQRSRSRRLRPWARPAALAARWCISRRLREPLDPHEAARALRQLAAAADRLVDRLQGGLQLRSGQGGPEPAELVLRRGAPGPEGEAGHGWEAEALKSATNGGTTPEAVDIVKGDSRGGMMMQAKFASPLKPGQHSVVVGFPTDACRRAMEVARLSWTPPRPARESTGSAPSAWMRSISVPPARLAGCRRNRSRPPRSQRSPGRLPVPVGVRSPNLATGALTLPADLPSSMLVEQASYQPSPRHRLFLPSTAGLERRPAAIPGARAGPRSIFNFVTGDSYSSTVSPALDTTGPVPLPVPGRQRSRLP